jgi:hypothetical protein
MVKENSDTLHMNPDNSSHWNMSKKKPAAQQSYRKNKSMFEVSSSSSSSSNSFDISSSSLASEDDPIVFKSSASRVVSKHHERAAEVCGSSSSDSGEREAAAADKDLKSTLKLINSRILRGNSAPSGTSFARKLSNEPDMDLNIVTQRSPRIELEKLKKIHSRILSPVCSPVAKQNNYIENNADMELKVITSLRCFANSHIYLVCWDIYIYMSRCVDITHPYMCSIIE